MARLTYSPDNRWVLEVFEMAAYDPTDATTAYLGALATVQATARLRNGGAVIVGETWPVTLTYRAGSDGAFWAYVEGDLTVDKTKRYEVEFAGDDGAGNDFQWVEALEIIDPRASGED